MENLPRHLFDSEYYYKTHPDVAKAAIDAYDHYFKYGIEEERDACYNYGELTLDQLKSMYYHTVPDDIDKPSKMPFNLKSDIASHLPILEYYASQCSHVTELGVRHGHSTIALLYGVPDHGVLESFDIEETPFVTWLKNKNLSKWEFHKADTGNPSLKINETDFIFFDTFHSYEQLNKELTLHASKSRRFLAFHDIFSCGEICNEDKSKEGIKRAIDEYVSKHKCKVLYQTNSCNGLLILEKL